jgi:hypothetical protein
MSVDCDALFVVIDSSVAKRAVWLVATYQFNEGHRNISNP